MRNDFFSRVANGASFSWTGVVCIALAFGCGEVNGTGGTGGNAPGGHLEPSQSDAMLPNATRSDATGSTSFLGGMYGALSGRNLTMSGNGPGKTGVIANSPYPDCTECMPSSSCTETCILPNGEDLSTCGTAGLVCSPPIGPMSPGVGVDWALATNGATVTASSQMTGAGWQGPASAAIDGDRIGALWWSSSNNYAGGGGWADNTPGVWPDWLEVDFAGTHTINEMDVFTVQTYANYSSNHVPTPSDLSTAEGLIDYQMQYCPSGVTCTNSSTPPYGTGWLDVTLGGLDVGHITNNGNTWRHVVFDAVQTGKIRILTNNGYANSSRIVEVEAWDTTAIGKNWALASNGATATVSSSYSATFGSGNAIDGDRSAWGYPNGPQAMWCSAQSPSASSPDIYAVNFASTTSISEIDLFGQQDAKTAAIVPTLSLGSTLFAFQDYRIQYCPAGSTCSAATTYPGSGWVDVPGSPATSTSVWNQFIFPAVQTQQIRAVFTSIANHDYSRIAEIEAWDYSNAPAARSADYATATALRRKMANVTGCGAIQPTTIGGESGREQACQRLWLDWSAATGAWVLPEDVQSQFYFGGTQTWPSTATTTMANLGFQSGPHAASSSGGDYTLFEHGIIADAAGSSTSYVIGGVPQCTDTQCASGSPDAACSCNAARVNGALASTWFNDTQTNKYPSSGTREYSLGVCASSGSGERSFLFDGSPDASGNSTTYIVRDNSEFAHEILGTERAAWESANCATQTALGLPLTNEMPFTLTGGTAATHQEFEGGTITSAPITTPIETFEHGPTTVVNMAATLAPAEPNMNSCTNGPSIPYTGSDGMPGTYYFHCTGGDHAGPGASSGSGWFDGVTLDTDGGAEYTIDGDALGYWLSQGSDQSVASAIAANSPPYFQAPWKFDGNGVMAPPEGSGLPPCDIYYHWFDQCTAPPGDPICTNDTDATFDNQYTTPDGYMSGSDFAATDPQSALKAWHENEFPVPVACGDYNCIWGTYGDPSQTSPTECAWAKSDTTSRKPTRLTLTITVDPTSGSPIGSVFVKLQENQDGRPDPGTITWLDTQPPFFQPGEQYTFDLLTNGINDLSDITELRIGNTDTRIPLRIDDVTLKVDDDGELNGGDLCSAGAPPGCTGGTSGTGKANRLLFEKHFSSYASTISADPEQHYGDPQSIFISGSELRTSTYMSPIPGEATWLYQVEHWSSVTNWFSSAGPHHFNGFDDEASLGSFITSIILAKVQKGHPGVDVASPVELTASGTGFTRLHFVSNLVSPSLIDPGITVSGDAVIKNYCYDDGADRAQVVMENVSASQFGFSQSPTLGHLFSLPKLNLTGVGFSWVPNVPTGDTTPTATAPALGWRTPVPCDCYCPGTCADGSTCPAE